MSDDFKEDLKVLESDGAPLWDGFATLTGVGSRDETTRVAAFGCGSRRGGTRTQRDRDDGDARTTTRHHSPIRSRAIVDFSNSLLGSLARASRNSMRARVWSPWLHSTSARWMPTSASGRAS